MTKLANIANMAAEKWYSPGRIANKALKWGGRALQDGPMATLNFASSAFNRIKNQGFSTAGVGRL